VLFLELKTLNSIELFSISGVFTSCMLNIFGLVVFLRAGWMVVRNFFHHTHMHARANAPCTMHHAPCTMHHAHTQTNKQTDAHIHMTQTKICI
jgi:hypothetical protein